MRDNEITELIIGCAIEVHRILGPGLLESAYQTFLISELKHAGLDVKSEVAMPVIYKDIKLNQGYRIDVLVENRVVVELKTVETLTNVHKAQLLTYLRLGDYRVGLLLNFNVNILKSGIKRIVN